MMAMLAFSADLAERPLLWIVDATLHASVLIVFVLVLQAVLRDRLTPRWRYALWLLVAVRLCLPVSIESPVSAFNVLPTWRVAALDAAAVDQQSMAPLTAQVTTSDETFADAGTGALHHSEAIDLGRPGEHGQDGPLVAIVPIYTQWLSTAAMIWLLGVIVAMAGMFVTARQYVRLARMSVRADGRILTLRDEAARLVGARCTVDVRVSDRATAPCLVGTWRPVIVLPRQMIDALTTFELRCVLMHELAHDRQHDVLVNWLLAGVLVLHWFNPLVWVAMRRLRAERELLRDAMVLDRLESRQRGGYARLLLTLAESLGRGPASMTSPVAATMSVRRSQLHRRMHMIITHSTSHRSASRLGWALIAALGMATLTSATGPDGPAASPLDDRANQPALRVDDREGVDVRVITLKHTRAADVAAIINEIIEGTRARPGIDTRELDGVAVIPDERTNALIIAAKDAQSEVLMRMIEQIDVAPQKQQVHRDEWPAEIVIRQDGPSVNLALRMLELSHEHFARRLSDLAHERVVTERGHTMRIGVLDRAGAAELLEALHKDDTARMISSPTIMLPGTGSAHVRIGGDRTLTLPRHELPKFQETIEALDGLSIHLNASWREPEKQFTLGLRGRYTEFAEAEAGGGDAQQPRRMREAVLDLKKSLRDDQVLLVAVPFEAREVAAVRVIEDPLSDRIVREIVKTPVEEGAKGWIVVFLDPSIVADDQ